MHPEALRGAERMMQLAGIPTVHQHELVALDLGGADINGTARSLLPNAKWFGLDLEAGPGVDIVADARSWVPDRQYDLVLCTELLEHVEGWEQCVITAARALRRGGHFIVTCASTGRRPHGARGGMDPEPGEWYMNVPADMLAQLMLMTFSTSHVEYNRNPGDAYGWARK